MLEDLLRMNFMPPYICKCGHTMGVELNEKGEWVPIDLGCQPGHCAKESSDEVDSSRKRQ